MIELKNRVDPDMDLSFQIPLPLTSLGIGNPILYYKIGIYSVFYMLCVLKNIKCTKYIFKISKT